MNENRTTETPSATSNSTSRPVRVSTLLSLFVLTASLGVVLMWFSQHNDHLWIGIVGVGLLSTALVFGAWTAGRMLLWLCHEILTSVRSSSRPGLTIARWATMFAVCVSYAFVAGGSVTACWFWLSGAFVGDTEGQVWRVLLLVFGGTGGIVLLFVSAVTYWVRKKWHDHADRILLTADMVSFLLLIAVILYLRRDDPPLRDDYSVRDLPVPAQNAQETHELWLTYRKDVSYPNLQVDVFLRFGDFWLTTNALPHAREIEAAWEQIAEARALIDRMDGFDAIADLTEPSFDAPIPSFVAYRNIAWTYWAYTSLLAQQGKAEDAARHLARLHSVFRKGLPCSRSLVTRMPRVAIIGGNVHAAREIMRQAHDDRRVLEVFKPAFGPIPEEDISPRKSIIWEYLTFKVLLEDKSLERFCQPVDRPPPSRFLRSIAFTFSRMLVNPNRTIRCAKEMYHVGRMSDEEVEELVKKQTRVWPPKNILGRLLLAIAIPSFERTANQCLQTKVRSDILALEIRRRLGELEKTDLVDPYTSLPYARDLKTGTFFSPGSDKIAGTQDDVTIENLAR